MKLNFEKETSTKIFSNEVVSIWKTYSEKEKDYIYTAIDGSSAILWTDWSLETVIEFLDSKTATITKKEKSTILKGE